MDYFLLYLLLEKPLVTLSTLLGFATPPLVALFFVLLFACWLFASAKEPAIAFHWGAIGGCYGAFSSSYIRVPAHQTTPVSGGGAHNMNDLVQIRTEPPLVPSSFDKLY